MTDYSKAFDEGLQKMIDENANILDEKLSMQETLDWVKPMLMEAIEALEFYEECWLENDPDEGTTARQALASIREKLGAEE